MTNRLFYKSMSIGVILLFLVVAVQPCLATIQPEIVDTEYFDVTTEFIGLGKEYTTQLTKEEIKELVALFDSIYDRINNSKSHKETINIFKETVLKLDCYGLLGDVGIKETEKLVTNSYQNTIFLNTFEKLYNRKMRTFGEDENRFCLIVGRTGGFVFLSHITLMIVISLIIYFAEHGSDDPMDEAMLDVLMVMMMYILSISIPFCLGRIIGFEDWARGTIISFGLNGLKYWNGNLKGKLEFLEIEDADIGVLGFTGLKIEILTYPYQYFIGFARRVHIEDS